MATLENIQARIAKLQAQAEALVTTKSSAVLEKIRGLMEKHAVTVADIEAFVGKRRGRKSGNNAALLQPAAAAKYRDPKSGALWSGRGRAPAWIANARNRARFLIEDEASAPAAKKVVKAGNYIRGPLPALYRNPKSDETWSGRGRAPAWLAGAKDRSKFLITNADAPAAAPKVKAAKAVTARKPVAKKAVVSKKAPAAKKAAAKTAAAPSRKTASKDGATAKPPVARKARVREHAVETRARRGKSTVRSLHVGTEVLNANPRA
ncbi:H-NS family nucleoid-associated regulatory protein [Paraburkholderia guartelaensis]|uniref:H-NS family nucleoid-associated regulatory protein n=1 Tax=Paraburkholderia guartelaensis TaxID=2546446 RepID=UPI002AB67648|nr:H-NS family nucleoid-associated regulatory protein [Paraburkholderia guartelaensis]